MTTAPSSIPTQEKGRRPVRAAIPALLLLVAFAVALLLPLAATDFQGSQTLSTTEKRALTAFPEWSWTADVVDAFPSRFEAAFNDHFGFRAPLVEWQSRFKVCVLGVSSTPNVVLGKQGWLYLAETVKEARGVVKVRPSEIDAWVRYLQAKQAWLAARNVRYLFVIVPNKERVYPEYLPDSLHAVRADRFSDRLVERLGREPGIDFLDLRPVLLDAKAQGLVFDRTDTHWSQLGAFIGANRILERLHAAFPDLSPASLSSRETRSEPGAGGDLAVMLGLPHLLTETRLRIPHDATAVHPAPLRLNVEWPAGSYHELPTALESDRPGASRTLLLCGNSFTSGLLDYLPEHFQRVVRMRPMMPYPAWFEALTPRLVDAEKPDIYIDVLSERHLKRAPHWGCGDE